MKMSQFAKADFVHDLARLRIAPIIAFGGLVLRQASKRALRKVWRDSHILIGNRQAVASKERDKPGYTGSRYPRLVRYIHVIDTQRAHVVYRLAIRAIEIIVGRGNAS